MLTPLQTSTIHAIINIFESGRSAADYSAVSVIDGSDHHLCYGRPRVSLASGNLTALVNDYCATRGAAHAAALRCFLARLQQRDLGLDRDPAFHAALALAGADPVMRALQDRSFDRLLWQPALKSAKGVYVHSALSTAIVLESCTQGGWAGLRNSVTGRHGRPPCIREECWMEFYVRARRRWLASSNPHRPDGARRMDAFLELIATGNWDLDLPITVRGVTVPADLLQRAA